MKPISLLTIGITTLALHQTSGHEVFRTDFNDSTAQGWQLSTSAGSPSPILTLVPGDSTGTASNGHSVLQIDDSASVGSSSYTSLFHAFTAQTGGFLDISFKIRFLSSGTSPEKGDWRVALNGALGTIYLRMKCAAGSGLGFSTYNSTTNTFIPSSITQLILGDWYEVKISADLKKGSYGWTARNLTNNVSSQQGRLDGSSFYQTGTSASSLSVTSVQRGGKFQIDDVRLNGFANNIAEAASYQVSPAPNYSYCTESGDVTQATDGIKRAPGPMSPSLWTLPECIGWVNVLAPITITVDLGQIKPISGLSVNMVAGTSAGVTWPAHILCFSSNDGVNWYYLTDLVANSEKSRELPSDGAWINPLRPVYKFASDVHSYGRYVCYSVLPTSPFAFIDEVEVYGGDSAWLTEPRTGTVVSGSSGIANYSLEYRTRGGALKRIVLDENELSDRIDTSEITSLQKANLQVELETAANSAMSSPTDPPASFRAVMPLNSGHANMFSVQGELWRDLGLTQPVIWRSHRYGWLNIFHTPPIFSDTSAINTSMLKDEYRAESIAISNPTEAAINVSINPENIIGGSGWLKVFESLWTDTFVRKVVPSALNEIVPSSGVYSLAVPPGMTKILWLQVDSHNLLNGTSSGDIRFQIGQNITSIPWNLRVSLFPLDTPRMTVYMWDYLNGSGAYGLNTVNRPAALQLMRSHYINTVWGTQSVLPTPTASYFNSNDQLVTALNFSLLDNWILNEAPNADQYFVFLANPGTSSDSSFAGASMGTPAFNARIGSWIQSIANHMAAVGVNPSKLAIHVWDEPSQGWQFNIAAQWLRAIKAGDSRVKCFINPAISSTANSADYSPALDAADIICPHTFLYNQSGADVRTEYQNRRASGKLLHFYLGTGPAKFGDPTRSFRLNAWHTFKEGGTGMGFWSLGDIGKATSSWNEYSANANPFTPLFLSSSEVNSSVHFEALREGIEDYELFKKVDDAVRLNPTSDLTQRWSDLKSRIQQYSGNLLSTTPWQYQSDSQVADEIRVDAIKLLENANGLNIP